MSDLINRQAAINEIDEWIEAFRENGHKESAADACLIQDGIIQLPSAEPERKKGKWIKDGHHIQCNQCGISICDKDREGDVLPKNFCPNCGAKMEEGGE